MKRFLLMCIVAVMALALATPSMAALKLTSKGRMDVTGIWMSNNIVDQWNAGSGGRSNNQDEAIDWFQQELVIDPTLHINEKVRIHARITMLERTWAGRGAATPGPGNGFENDYRGSTNFWVERLYLSFPLLGGTLYAGRMSAAMWGYDFYSNNLNGDRIKYVRRFGHIVGILVYEKLGESDDTGIFTQTPQNIGASGAYTNTGGDIDLYAVAAIIPITKNIITRQIFVWVNWGGGARGGNSEGYDFIAMPTLMIKAGIFKFETEFIWRTRHLDDGWIDAGDNDRTKYIHVTQCSWWAEAGVHPGPFDFVLGGFWHQGTASRKPWENGSIAGVGGEFQPYLLLFSEDMGLLWNTGGVPNGSVGLSGYRSIYFRAGYKINDTMKLYGVYGMLWADKMLYNTSSNLLSADADDVPTTPDKFLGAELDIGFRWDFMDNLAYVVEAGYLWAGSYWNGYAGFNADRNVFGMRHMLVINW